MSNKLETKLCKAALLTFEEMGFLLPTIAANLLGEEHAPSDQQVCLGQGWDYVRLFISRPRL